MSCVLICAFSEAAVDSNLNLKKVNFTINTYSLDLLLLFRFIIIRLVINCSLKKVKRHGKFREPEGKIWSDITLKYQTVSYSSCFSLVIVLTQFCEQDRTQIKAKLDFRELCYSFPAPNPTTEHQHPAHLEYKYCYNNKIARLTA